MASGFKYQSLEVNLKFLGGHNLSNLSENWVSLRPNCILCILVAKAIDDGTVYCGNSDLEIISERALLSPK